MKRANKWVSTRSDADVDARRDFDGFDVDEELRRLNAALSVATPPSIRFAAEAMVNIDEWLGRGGALPKRWWKAGSARPNGPGGIATLAEMDAKSARVRGRSKRRPSSRAARAARDRLVATRKAKRT